MENSLFLGVPILKHIRVDQLAQMQRLPVIMSIYHSKFSVPPIRRTYADGVSILSLNRKTGVAGICLTIPGLVVYRVIHLYTVTI